jgi:NAD-dependent deacetylase
MDEINRVAKFINESRSTVALSGAGMSTESGIPDFRSPRTGLWTKIDPMEFATIDSFTSGSFDLGKIAELAKGMGPELTKMLTAKPNKGHFALAELEKMGKLDCIITQNVDMLHTRAGSKNVIEIHGTMRTASCMSCGRKMSSGEMMRMVLKARALPPNCDCGGIIKPDVVMFGEQLPPEALSRSMEYASRCDLMLAVGSSLVVYPVASLPSIAKRSGAKLVIVSIDPTSYDKMADVVIHGKVGEILPQIVDKVKAMAA